LFGGEPLERYTKNTIATIDILIKDCALIKKRGFALDESEYHEDLRCIAAPIRIHNGAIVGSIGISAPISRFPKTQLRVFAEHVCKTAQDIGSRLSDSGSSSEEE
jgi:IclR family acetate operon transcriptional repressor